MNRINIFATMGFTGIAIAITLLVASDKPGIRTWATILGIFSILMVGLAFIISGQEDKKEKNNREEFISELRKANQNIGDLVNEIREERNERKRKRKPK